MPPSSTRDYPRSVLLVGHPHAAELEPVVEAKLRALAEEHASLPQAVAEACGAERYAELCALAASHANPWWGGCIAPFNTTLNWARRPNVSFEPRGSKWVVGLATRSATPASPPDPIAAAARHARLLDMEAAVATLCHFPAAGASARARS